MKITKLPLNKLKPIERQTESALKAEILVLALIVIVAGAFIIGTILVLMQDALNVHM